MCEKYDYAMKRLLPVDGSNLLFQMFFGVPARIVNRQGKAIQGTLFLNTLPFSNVIFIGNGIILMLLTQSKAQKTVESGKGKRLMIDELYDSLYKELTGWCTSMTGSRSLAEDLMQEAFLRALINAALLEELDTDKRRAWMFRTMKNLYIDTFARVVAAYGQLACQNVVKEGDDEAGDGFRHPAP